jgi:hypothetical protein
MIMLLKNVFKYQQLVIIINIMILQLKNVLINHIVHQFKDMMS